LREDSTNRDLADFAASDRAFQAEGSREVLKF
jgi:hypothetical protein